MWQDPTGGERGMLAVGRVSPSAVCYPRLMNLSERQTIPLLVLCGLLAIVVFAIDLNLPLGVAGAVPYIVLVLRSEEHTSELQSLMRISYAVFCFKKKHKQINQLLLYYYNRL